MVGQFDKVLPVDDAAVGTFLRGISDIVIPVLNLADYDPDNPSAPGAADANFRTEFGTILRLNRGSTAVVAAGGTPQIVRYPIGGVPAGEVHVIRELTVEHDEAANRDWDFEIQGYGVTNYTQTIGRTRVEPNTRKNIFTDIGLYSLTPRDSNHRLPIILGPNGIIVATQTINATAGKLYRMTVDAEVYQTTLSITDSSALIG